MKTSHYIIINDFPISEPVFGEQDCYIEILETMLDLKILYRGNRFELQGNTKSINIGQKMIEMIIQKHSLHRPIHKSYLQNKIQHLITHDSLNPHLSSSIKLTEKKTLYAKNISQQQFLNKILNNTISFGVGPAGIGKTYITIACAIYYLSQGYKKIILTRPVVEAGESLGFLPGTLEDKIAPYLQPLMDALKNILSVDDIQDMIAKQIIEIIPLAYMRGRSLNNAFIILDEAQNASHLQMKMFLTRLGENSKMVITGDLSQTDLSSNIKSGLETAIHILNNTPDISITQFTKQDSVRNSLVVSILNQYERLQV